MAVKKAKKNKNEKVNKKIDLEGLLSELQVRFDSLSEKLDTVLSKTSVILSMINSERDPGFKTEATVTKKFTIPQDNVPRERKMYKAVCAECKVECEVPFVPRAERPVYCKTCYSNRRKENNQRNMPNRDQIVEEIAKTLNIDMSAPVEAKKISKKKNTGTKVLKGKTPTSKKNKTKR